MSGWDNAREECKSAIVAWFMLLIKHKKCHDFTYRSVLPPNSQGGIIGAKTEGDIRFRHLLKSAMSHDKKQ